MDHLARLATFTVATVVVEASTTAALAKPIAPPPPAKDGSVSASAKAWAPPAQVNRTAVGGAPPPAAWGVAAGKAGPTTLGIAAGACDPATATGILKSYPVEKFPVSDRTQLLVNTVNGNVVVNSSDLTIKGTGQNLALNHVYNSRLAGGGALSSGWMLNTGQDVGLTVDGAGNVTLHGESGYCATFTKNTDGSYKSALGGR